MKDVLTPCRDVLGVTAPSVGRCLHRNLFGLGTPAILDAVALGLLALVVGPLTSGDDVGLPIVDIVSVVVVISVICVPTPARWLERGFGYPVGALCNLLNDATLNGGNVRDLVESVYGEVGRGVRLETVGRQFPKIVTTTISEHGAEGR